MTIAAGLLCKGGLVLCADTQETIPGYVKQDSLKIRGLKLANCWVGMTGAGDTDLIEVTAQEIINELMSNPDRNSNQIESVIKGVAHKVFKQHIQPYAHFAREERPSADLLIALQGEAFTCLYKLRGTVFRRLDASECIGTGVVLAKSLIDQLANPDLSLVQMGIVALYILYQAKRWVDGCGGNSDVFLLSNRNLAKATFPTNEVQGLEVHFEAFLKHLPPILIGAADKTMPQVDFDQVLHRFVTVDMLGLRAKFMSMDEFFQRVQSLIDSSPRPSVSQTSEDQK